MMRLSALEREGRQPGSSSRGLPFWKTEAMIQLLFLPKGFSRKKYISKHIALESLNFKV